MVKIVFRTASKGEYIVEAGEGQALLEVAQANDIPGIIGDCGGEMSCGTCHAYVDPAWFVRLPTPSPDEQVMLEDGVLDPKPTSRLCCQLIVASGLDGLTVEVPDHF